MAISEEYRAFLLDLFGPLGPVRVRGMFGGAGIFHGEVMFGLVAYEALYLKADEINRPVFEDGGWPPFVYQSPNGKRVQMPYWQVPDALMDEVDELRDLARGAIDAAYRAARAKAVKKRPAAGKAAAKAKAPSRKRA